MDLNLKLLYQQQNDNKAIILSDITDNYGRIYDPVVAPTTLTENQMYQVLTVDVEDFTAQPYGAAANAVGERFVTDTPVGVPLAGTSSVYDVTPSVPRGEITALTLDIKFTGTNKTEVVYSQIDLIAEFGPFTNQSEMVYTINAGYLGGTDGDLIPDGLYELDYNVTYKGVGSLNSKTELLNTTILVYGQVKVGTYQKLRQIPTLYMCKDGAVLEEILEADICGAYLSGIEASAYIAKTEELLNMLIVLEDIILNGSRITY